MKQCNRIAYTLIEFLVVIAITGILIALILSAVQKVRESANRTICLNQLRQLALALQQHHDAAGQLPVGYFPVSGTSAMPATGWPLAIAPLLEQPTLLGIADSDFKRTRNFLEPGAPHRNLSFAWRAFTCPSDGRIGSAVYLSTFSANVAFTSYVGNCGRTCSRENGVLFPDSKIHFREITDGLSHTLLLSERPPSHDLRYGWWYAGLGTDNFGTAEMILGVREPNSLGDMMCPSGPFGFQASRFSDSCGMFHPWSPHPGGAHFAFADGSARFVSYSADSILPALATRAGGETVELP